LDNDFADEYAGDDDDEYGNETRGDEDEDEI